MSEVAMWGKITEAESVRRMGVHQNDFHPSVWFHPMVRMGRDLASVARFYRHALLSKHNGATSGDDPAMLPHVVPMRSSVSLKSQTLHKGLFAPGHRDLKPSNVMVFKGASGEERIKILDFVTEFSCHPRFCGSNFTFFFH